MTTLLQEHAADPARARRLVRAYAEILARKAETAPVHELVDFAAHTIAVLAVLQRLEGGGR